MQRITELNSERLLIRLAEDFETQLTAELESKSRVFVLLTGGSLGIAVLEEISRLNLPWDRIDFCFSDERFVPLVNPDRNEYQALTVWPALAKLNFLRFPDSNMNLWDARSEFNNVFEARFGNVEETEPVFDLVILGFGPDGHIASLFPGHSYPRSWIVAEGNSPKPPIERLSMSYQALNRAQRIWFLAAGIGKAEAVRCAMNEQCELPLAKVRASEMRWYLDKELSDAL